MITFASVMLPEKAFRRPLKFIYICHMVGIELSSDIQHFILNEQQISTVVDSLLIKKLIIIYSKTLFLKSTFNSSKLCLGFLQI